MIKENPQLIAICQIEREINCSKNIKTYFRMNHLHQIVNHRVNQELVNNKKSLQI